MDNWKTASSHLFMPYVWVEVILKHQWFKKMQNNLTENGKLYIIRLKVHIDPILIFKFMFNVNKIDKLN